MTITVHPFGPRSAKIVIIGEAPGSEEEARGVPFIGPSGRMLDRLLAGAGISRSACYLTNVMKVRPPSNDFGYFYEDSLKRNKPKPELLAGWESLRAEVRSLSPSILVPLGAEALRAILPARKGIEAHRGFVHRLTEIHPGLPVVATYHPANLFRAPENYPITALDLKKAGRIAISGPRERSYSILTGLNFRRIVAVLQGIAAGALGPRISFDIETVGQHTRCLGLAWSETHALVVPFLQRRSGISLDETESPFENAWTEEEERQILDVLFRIFSNPGIEKVAQNFPFDSTILEQDFGLPCVGLAVDTLLLSHSCHSELPKSLDFLTSIYTDLHKYSDYNSSLDSSTWTYNGFDCCVTFEVAGVLEGEARELGCWEHFQTIVMPAMHALTRVQNRGVRVDEVFRATRRQSCQQREVELLQGIHALAGQELNPNSPKQMKEYLYGELKLPKRRLRGEVTVNEDALRALARKFPQHEPLLRTVLEYRGERKFRSTYLEARLREDHRLTTSYNVAGTVNGRISSGKTIFGIGGNLQNVPKNARPMFLPEEGHVWIKVDLSQAEVRVVAWIARIHPLIERFLDEPGFDIHRWSASLVFGVSEDTVSSAQRAIGKIGVHGGNYGLGPQKASTLYDIPFQDAKRSLEGYRSAIPELQTWWTDVQNQLQATRVLRTPLGRVRRFLGLFNDELYRSAYSFIPQAVVADVIAIAFTRAEQILVPAVPTLQVHDEINFSCPRSHLPRCLELLHSVMWVEIPVDGVARPLVIPWKVTVGKDWFNQHPVEEFLGA